MAVTEVVDTRHGPMKIFSNDPGCSRLVKEYGEFSPGELAIMGLWINKDSVVVDAGANIGALTVPLALLVKKVYAFEPQSKVAEVLQDNTKHLPNVEVIQCGLGDVPCIRCCGPETSNWGVESTGSVSLIQNTGSEEVEIKTLDSFELAPTLLKIDVEGMEPHVIAGAKETIKKYRPAIWMERGYPDRVLNNIFNYFGYRYCSIDIPMWWPNNYRGNPVDIYPGMAHLSVLAWPN